MDRLPLFFSSFLNLWDHTLPVHWTRLYGRHVSCVVVEGCVFSQTQQQEFVEWVEERLPFTRGEPFLGRYEYHHFSHFFHTTPTTTQHLQHLTTPEDLHQMKSVTKKRLHYLEERGEEEEGEEREREDVERLCEFVNPVARLVEGLKFNDVWIQRYTNGSFLNSHRDPPSFRGTPNTQLTHAKNHNTHNIQ